MMLELKSHEYREGSYSTTDAKGTTVSTIFESTRVLLLFIGQIDYLMFNASLILVPLFLKKRNERVFEERVIFIVMDNVRGESD